METLGKQMNILGGSSEQIVERGGRFSFVSYYAALEVGVM